MSSMLDLEYSDLFKNEYLNAADLNALIDKYNKSKGEDKFKLRDEIFYNVARFIGKKIAASSLIDPKDREEVFNIATLNFYTCLEKYETKRNLSFLTYLEFWVKKSIYDFRYKSSIINIGRGAFQSDTMRQHALRACNKSLVYLDKPVDSEEDDLKFQLEDLKAMTGFGVVEDKNLDELLRNTLTIKQYLVIRFRYMNEEQWNFSDFRPLIKTTGERARQIEGAALFKLRKLFNGMPVPTHLDDKPDPSFKMPSEEFLANYNEEVIKKHEAMKLQVAETSRQIMKRRNK